MSFWKQEPPKPTEAFRNLGPMRLSVPMHRATSLTSAPASMSVVRVRMYRVGADAAFNVDAPRDLAHVRACTKAHVRLENTADWESECSQFSQKQS